MLRKLNKNRYSFQEVWEILDENYEYLEDLIKRASINFNYETFDIGPNGGRYGDDRLTFRLKSPYIMNSNALEVYVDGVRQHPDSYDEVNKYTVRLRHVDKKNSRVDIYYREHSEVDSLSYSIDSSPIYYLSEKYKVVYNRGVTEVLRLTDVPIVPSNGILWRVIVTPESSISVGELTVRDTSVEFPISNNLPEGVTINQNSGSVIFDYNYSNAENEFLYLGDKVSIPLEFKRMYPRENHLRIIYVVKQLVEPIR